MSVPRVPIKRDVLVDLIDKAALQADLTYDQIAALLDSAKTTAAVGVGDFTGQPSCPWTQTFGVSQGGGHFARAFDRAADLYVLARPGGRKWAFYTLVVEDD